MEFQNQTESEIDYLDPFALKTEIVQYDQANPFFLPVEGSTYRFQKLKFLTKEYQCVYILCLSNDFDPTPSNKNLIKLFYCDDSDIAELKAQSHMVTLVKAPMELLHLDSIRDGLMVVGSDILEYFNDGHSLQAKELVYLMLETKEHIVKKWLQLYKSNNIFDEYLNQKVFATYYQLRDRRLENYLLSAINSVGDFRYWEDPYHCQISINNAFVDRIFNLKICGDWKLPLKDMDKELQNIMAEFKNNKDKIKNPGYPDELTQPNFNEIDSLKIGGYTDASKKDKNVYYRVVEPKDLTIDLELIEELLDSVTTTEKEKYYLLSNCLVSQKYCHYILNNPKILSKCKYIFDKYSPIFRYLIGYAWIIFYTEESAKKSRSKQTDRYVLDINTASQLPIYPFSHDAPHYNPYFCLPVSKKVFDTSNNIHGVKQSIEFQHGIVTLEEFRRRFNIFTTGYSDRNLFHGVNWSNMVITGGMMPAIMPMFNPLMAQFKTLGSDQMTDEELHRYFQEYYASSDLDIACNHGNVLDYIEHVKHLRQILTTNLQQHYPDAKVNVCAVKTLAIYINNQMLKEKCQNGTIPFSYNYIVQNRSKKSVILYFYEFYIELKKKSNLSNRKILGDKINDDEYFEIINLCDMDHTKLIINDYSFECEMPKSRTADSNSGIEMIYFISKDGKQDISDGNIFMKFSETLKYKISSNCLLHQLEVFRINEPEYFSCIARFHLPCVRAYYNGQNCYMLPSAVTAYHTLTNIDIKYCVGQNDPIEIIDKYRRRGYGIVLNQCEINQYLSYVMAVDSFKKSYGVKETKDLQTIKGPLDITHRIFRPRQYMPEKFAHDPNIKLNYLDVNIRGTTVDDIKKYFHEKYPKFCSDFIDIVTIQHDGTVAPPKRWLIDAAYDLLSD